MERPIVLCGLGRMGKHVLEFVRAGGLPVVVVDTVAKTDDPCLEGVRLVVGDCRRREVLEEAGVAEARGVLILTNDDLLNITTALMVRSLNPDVGVVLRMFNQNLLGRLGKAVHNVFALSTSKLTAPMLAMIAVTGQGLGAFRLEGQEEEGPRQVVELTVTAGSDLRARAIGRVVGPREVVVLAHLPAQGTDRFLLDVDLEAPLEAGDRLVVCGEPRAVAPLLSGKVEGTDPDLMWAGWLRRMGRVAWRTLAELDLAVLIAAGVLIAVLLTSTLVLHFGVTRYSFSNAFLRTVSIIATGDRLHDEDFNDLPRIELFVSIMRIFGAVLMAAFTALVTNYLLRARLGGAFELRRIPDGGHVVVCGLSTIGFRVIEELLALEERVVVIERNATNRFVATARRLGAAVIIADAAVTEVLRQAHAASARCVLSTTNNDMTNLEVALLVRELNPSQRIVLLLNDPQFAQMLREAAHVRFALSVPALAAPAFIAGLFGDRVASVFLVRERLFAVIDLLINPDDPFAGHAVRAVAVDYRLQPITVLRPSGPPPRPLLAARLEAGDRLVAIIALADLERLLRRQPCSAEFAVEVTSVPLPARGWLAGLVRTLSGTSAEDAEKALGRLPLRLADNLTRGQAEDLFAQLVRERVAARVCSSEGAAVASIMGAGQDGA
jgi:Trk K+ transport system NAD-binding subunit